VQGIKFTENVVADPDLPSACQDATMMVFVLPHQFLGRICPQMTTMAKGCRALSLIKGIEFEEGGPILISNMIKDAMSGMDVSVLMGANVANEGKRGTPARPERTRRRKERRARRGCAPAATRTRDGGACACPRCAHPSS
jgi:glycerol-3-phosphate dehydrogenase